MTKVYILNRWHSSDKSPSVQKRGTIEEVREEFEASISHDRYVAGLYPVEAEENKVSMLRLASPYAPFVIQYWIEEAPEVRYSLIYCPHGTTSRTVSTGRTKEEVLAFLKVVGEEFWSDWHIEGNDQSLHNARYWQHNIGEK